MRPVVANKGGQGLYRWNLASNLSASTWTFLQGNRTAAVALFGVPNPTIEQCLDTWLEIAKIKNKQAKRKAGFDNKQILASAVESRIGPIYREAGNPLLTQIGTFCSYCEMYLPDALQVEHVAPKAQYPMFCLAWENFNLSCGPCNGRAAKYTRPTRATVVADWMGGAQPGDGQEIDYYTSIRDNITWPDGDPDAFVGLKPRLMFESRNQARLGQWVPVPAARSVSLDMRADPPDIPNRTVMANIYITKTAMAKRSVRVEIEGGYGPSDEMIDLTMLNNPGDSTGTISDRRLIQRTAAWFSILEFLSVAQWVRAPGFNAWWSTLLSTSKTTGFYSVWVQILKLTKMTDPNTGNLLVDRFVADTNAPAYYPGTDTTYVPGP